MDPVILWLVVGFVLMGHLESWTSCKVIYSRCFHPSSPNIGNLWTPIKKSARRIKRIPPSSHGAEPPAARPSTIRPPPPPPPAPQPHPPPPSTTSPSPLGRSMIGILSQTDENNYDGTFSYSYSTANGIEVEARGYQKPGDGGQAMEGHYSYTAPDGTPVVTRWFADETGFHAEGSHIPGRS